MVLKQFKDITHDNIGEIFQINAKIETVKQTSGPTLMVLNDGSANFTFKAFLKPGARAYPEVDVGDYVTVKAQVKERKEGIEGEVLEMKKLDEKDLKDFMKKIDELNEERIKIDPNTPFSIKSEVLEKLKPRFLKVALIIKKAISEGRPILLRHNADCDGYSSAITIERAVLAFMDEMSGGDRQLQFQNYRRAPSKAPFYEYEDSVKDVMNLLRDEAKQGLKPPLIIITDNGSTEEDILSIKQMKIYDCQIVVVDHHYPGVVEDGKVEVDKYIDAHINPYLEGFDSNVCAGMLGYELAKFIYPNNKNSVFIPAMAAILDHTEGTEREQYIELAKAEGFTEEYLATLGEIVDMQSHYLRFQEGREFIDDLFGNNMKMQEGLVEMLGVELKKRYDATMKVAEHYTEKEDYGAFYLMHFDGERGTSRGEYPAIGKTTNHIHKTFEERLDKPVITMTSGSTFLTIRVSDAINHFSVPEFCSIVSEKMSYTYAEGGGHEKAGSVKFVEYGRLDVIAEFKKYVKAVSEKQ